MISTGMRGRGGVMTFTVGRKEKQIKKERRNIKRKREKIYSERTEEKREKERNRGREN